MKHTLFILALITASIQTFAQSPRIKLNQITKDSLTGSVLISSPTDSGMVYSRDLFISYGADTVLILGGDTLAATSSIISSVLSDGVTITGDGTTGSELTVDTATVIATKGDLSDYVTIAGTETITGAKTFTSALNQSGGDVNFDSGTFFVDESEDRVGIGTSSPVTKLESKGDITINSQDGGYSGGITINKGISGVTGAAGAEYKNVALFSGYSSSITLIDYNLTAGLWQKTDEDGNYANFNFFSAQGNNLGGFGMNFIDHSGYVSDFYFATANGGIGSEKMRIKANGDIFVNNLYANTTSGGRDVQILSTGELYAVSSSTKEKNNIIEYDKGLSHLMKLNPKYFKYNNDNSGRFFAGFIAEEFDEIGLNEFVIYGKNGVIDGIDYDKTVALLTKAIQEQQAIIESQATEIEQLKTLITELSNRLQILENN